MPEIPLHGRRAWATTWSILFDNAKPGDKVTVAVKLLHAVDGGTLKIPTSRRATLIQKMLREEFLSAALLVPALAPGDAAQVATLNENTSAAIGPGGIDDDKKLIGGARQPLLHSWQLARTRRGCGREKPLDVVKRTFGDRSPTDV